MQIIVCIKIITFSQDVTSSGAWQERLFVSNRVSTKQTRISGALPTHEYHMEQSSGSLIAVPSGFPWQSMSLSAAELTMKIAKNAAAVDVPDNDTQRKIEKL